jgi:HPt (histidine-containing phosphotransfer) domain-containing protein
MPNEAPIFSTLQDRPALLPLVREFALALPEMADDIVRAATSGDLEQCRKLAHRLKGSAGGFGFPAIAEAAMATEAGARAGDGPATARTAMILAVLCVRARAGVGDAGEAPRS